MSEQATVASRSKLMEARESERLLPRRLMIGEEAVLCPEAAKTYFPREPLEQPVPIVTGYFQPEAGGPLQPRYGAGMIDPWEQRVGRLMGKLYNVFAEAVREAAGQIFANEPKVSEDTPPALAEFYKDVNGAGTDLHTFGLARMTTAVAEGIDYVLVDYPPPPVPGQVLVQRDEAQLGLRPTWKVYSAGSVLELTTEVFRGNVRVRRARLLESVSVPDGSWGERSIEQVRVLYPGTGDRAAAPEVRYARFEVWRRPDGKDDWDDAVMVPELSGVMFKQVDVPFVPFPTSISAELGEFDSPPPMLDLARKVIGHARKTSTLDNSQHMVGFPLLYWSGVDEDAAKSQLSGGVGSSRVFTGPPESELKHVEPAGTAWDSVKQAIDELVEQMHALAKAPRSERAQGPVTARGEVLGEARATVMIKAWAAFAQQALNTLAYYTWLYLEPMANPEADKGWGTITLNSEITPDPNGQTQTATALYTAMMEGRMSAESWWEAWKKIGMPVAGTWQEELERLNKQGPIGPVPEGSEDLTGADAEKPQMAVVTPPTNESTSAYSVGDKVMVKHGKDHGGAGKGETGTVEIISTPALGVKFPNMDEVHKWYVDEEVEPSA